MTMEFRGMVDGNVIVFKSLWGKRPYFIKDIAWFRFYCEDGSLFKKKSKI